MGSPSIHMKSSNKRLSSRAHKDWRASVLERDKGCIVCGKTPSEGIIASHHLIPACKKYSEWEYDIDNGVMLCASHHIWGIMSAHKHPFWFVDWFKRNRPLQYSRLKLRLARIEDEV